MDEARPPGLVARVWALITRPGRAWEAIAYEAADAGAIFKRHVAPLAAIPAVCGLMGPLIFATVWLLAQWIALLAPMFGGVRDRGQALKLAAYAPTAWWVAGVFELWPSLVIPVLILAGLYSLYALFLGLPKVMRAPEEHRLNFFAAVLLGLLVLIIVAGMLAAKAAELGGPLSLT